MHTGIFQEIDFEAPGRSLGFLGMPVSIDRSPYYHVKVPVCRFRNGEGPRILLMAGNHGDEYEGELALGRLIRRLDPARMRGTLTILPATNTPAVMAGRRCSPLDAGNLNRSFPGNPSGPPTQRLGHYLESVLFPQQDIVCDFHSGGTSMAHLPVALVEEQADAALFDRSLALMRTLGLAYGFIAGNGPASNTSLGAMGRAGAAGVSGEFGGGGTVTAETMRGTEIAIDRLLVAAGMLEAPVLRPAESAVEPAPMRILRLDRLSQSLYATRPGWFEPAVPLGTWVAAGDTAGWYHDLHRLDQPEERLAFAASGIVISQRLHTGCEAGDCLVQVARPAD